MPSIENSIFARVKGLWPGAPPVDHVHPVWSPTDVFSTVAAGAFCKLDRDGEINLHTHDFVELAIVAEGTGQQFANGEWRSIGPGDAFLLAPGAVHAYRNEGGLQVFNLLFQRTFWAQHLPALAAQPGALALFSGLGAVSGPPTVQRFPVDKRRHDQTVELLGRAREESARATATNAASVEWLSLYTLSVLCRGAAGAQTAQPATLPAAVLSAIEFATSNLDQPLSMRVLAQRAGLAPRELVRLFRQVTGAGPQQFIAALRVRTARNLLADPKRSITEVAFETGFYDGPHMTRTFTRLVGLSPRAYRQRLQAHARASAAGTDG